MKVAGTVFFLIDGIRHSLRGNIEIALGKHTREGVVGLDGVHGYKEIPAIPRISCDITDTEDLNLNTLSQITNSTITAELGNGKTGILYNAWIVDQPTLNADDGIVSVQFEGLEGKWA